MNKHPVIDRHQLEVKVVELEAGVVYLQTSFSNVFTRTFSTRIWGPLFPGDSINLNYQAPKTDPIISESPKLPKE